jgi:hypothetical protein
LDSAFILPLTGGKSHSLDKNGHSYTYTAAQVKQTSDHEGVRDPSRTLATGVFAPNSAAAKSAVKAELYKPV